MPTPKRSKSKKKSPGSFFDLDPAVRAQVLADFRQEFFKPGPLNPDLLKKWRLRGFGRRELLSDVVFGGIHWPKSRGRPLTPTLMDAFELVHEYHIAKGSVSDGGPVTETKWIRLPPPSLRDDSTDDYYRVAYQAFAQPLWDNQMTILMRSVPWERPSGAGRGYRFLEPYDQVTFGGIGELWIFPDVEVQYYQYSLAPLMRVIR